MNDSTGGRCDLPPDVSQFVVDDPPEELLIERGRRAAYRDVLKMALRELGEDATAERYAAERTDVIEFLRDVCARVGDNDWPDDLHLRDVIEKHLLAYLDVL